MWLTPKHVVSVDNFNSADELCKFFERVARLKSAHEAGVRSSPWKEYYNLLRGQVMASLFYQPSTRTRFSFESAMVQLGGSVIGTENAKEFSSTIKGESLQDSVTVVGHYAHVIVIRHPDVGSAAQAAAVSRVPVINAGDGVGEHPTQALLDLYTIWEQMKKGYRVRTLTLVGDLKRGRTVHSLVKLVKKFNRDPALRLNIRIVCVSPETLRLPMELRTLCGASTTEQRTLTPELVQESDVIYMTRTQSEHGAVQADTLVLTPAIAAQLSPTAIILHPLPRNEELPVGIDHLSQAHYFEQAENGLYVRMQLLIDLLNN